MFLIILFHLIVRDPPPGPLFFGKLQSFLGVILGVVLSIFHHGAGFSFYGSCYKHCHGKRPTEHIYSDLWIRHRSTAFIYSYRHSDNPSGSGRDIIVLSWRPPTWSSRGNIRECTSNRLFAICAKHKRGTRGINLIDHTVDVDTGTGITIRIKFQFFNHNHLHSHYCQWNQHGILPTYKGCQHDLKDGVG